jgi:hypothetical protein
MKLLAEEATAVDVRRLSLDAFTSRPIAGLFIRSRRGDQTADVAPLSFGLHLLLHRWSEVTAKRRLRLRMQRCAFASDDLIFIAGPKLLQRGRL